MCFSGRGRRKYSRILSKGRPPSINRVKPRDLKVLDLMRAIAVLALLLCTSEGKLCCFGSWGSVAESYMGKGVIYLFVAALLVLAYWGLTRLKPPKPKKHKRIPKKLKKK